MRVFLGFVWAGRLGDIIGIPLAVYCRNIGIWGRRSDNEAINSKDAISPIHCGVFI